MMQRHKPMRQAAILTGAISAQKANESAPYRKFKYFHQSPLKILISEWIIVNVNYFVRQCLEQSWWQPRR